MITVLIALVGIFIILIINELLWRRKFLHGELKRKFVHILATVFISSWPWFLSWRAIQLIGIIMVLVLLLNRQLKVLHYLGRIREKTYGDVFLALAATTSAILTDEKIFFTVALLLVALADGLAAIVGTKFGSKWRYKVFGQTKSVIGTMTFWVVAIFVLGIGLLGAQDLINYNQYVMLLLMLPPVLAAIENFAVYGLDNLAVPVVTILVLQSVSIA